MKDAIAFGDDGTTFLWDDRILRVSKRSKMTISLFIFADTTAWEVFLFKCVALCDWLFYIAHFRKCGTNGTYSRYSFGGWSCW